MGKVNEIVVALDTSSMANEVLKRAIEVGAQHGASLLVLHVIDVPLFEFPFGKSIDEQEVKRKIEAQVAALNAKAQVECSVLVLQGDPANIIAVESKKVQADLVVIGSHGKKDVESAYFGSTVRKIIQQTHVPVLLVKNRAGEPYRRMIAPTNLSDYSRQSILFAEALFGKASMKCLYAYEVISDIQATFYAIDEEERRQLQNKVASAAKTDSEKFLKRVGADEMELIEMTASVNDDLLNYITENKADLVVLGSKGVDNMNSFIYGSTASYLTQKSPTDVLVHVPES